MGLDCESWELTVKCSGLMTDLCALHLGDVERVCGVSGLSLELLECSTGLGGLWLCIHPPNNSITCCAFWVYGLL